jgi:rRNA processing protein Krr1/Pno1
MAESSDVVETEPIVEVEKEEDWSEIPWYLIPIDYEAQPGFAIEHRSLPIDDAAYVLGKDGKTKNKISRASQCLVNVIDNVGKVELHGGVLERTRAWKYIQCYVLQRHSRTIEMSDVHLTEDPTDVTVMEIPAVAMAYAMGRNAQCFMTMEEEFGCLLFTNSAKSGTYDLSSATKKLTIFGNIRARRSAELRIMSSVDMKLPNYYMSNGLLIEADNHPSGFDISILQIPEGDLNLALGRAGATRKKIQRASHCILEYIGNHAVFCGTPSEIRRAIFYFRLVGAHIMNHKQFENLHLEGRSDCAVVEIAKEAIGYVTGESRQTLSVIEDTYGTLLFFCHASDNTEKENLVIFGPRKARHGTILKVMSSVEAWFARKNTPNYFSSTWDQSRCEGEGFGIEYIRLTEDDLRYAVGKGGSTRKKISRASGAALEYVGSFAVAVGSGRERRLARDYLSFLLTTRTRENLAFDPEIATKRDDVSVVTLEQECALALQADSGKLLRSIEDETFTFLILTMGNRDNNNTYTLYIFSFSTEGRKRADKRLITEFTKVKLLRRQGVPKYYPHNAPQIHNEGEEALYQSMTCRAASLTDGYVSYEGYGIPEDDPHAIVYGEVGVAYGSRLGLKDFVSSVTQKRSRSPSTNCTMDNENTPKRR